MAKDEKKKDEKKQPEITDEYLTKRLEERCKS